MADGSEIDDYEKGRKILLERSIEHPFNRSLSSIESYSRMEKNNLIADFTYKIVLVGDSKVGKTSLLMTYIEKKFPQENVPQVFSNCSTTIKTADDKSVQLLMWDTSNDDEFKRLRPISYSGADLVLICYAVDDKQSLKNIEKRWVPEIKHFCYDVPYMVLGLKLDLYSDSPRELDELVQQKDIQQLKDKINSKAFIQCSALEYKEVDNIIDIALSLLMDDSPTGEPTSDKFDTSQSESKPILSKLRKFIKPHCNIA